MRTSIRLRLYATGKVLAFARGESAHAAVASEALRKSVVLEAKVNDERFVALMLAQGVPENVAREYLSSVTVDDEAYLRPDYPG